MKSTAGRRFFTTAAGWLLLGGALWAQQSAPPPVELTPAEKAFEESMTNVALAGYFTVGDSPDAHPDRYIVERVTKIKEDTWNFEARIQYNKKDYKTTIPGPVKWAGDTPVLMLANYSIPGQGIFSARILIHNGMYSGTWGSQNRGGKMFGNIVKNEPTE